MADIVWDKVVDQIIIEKHAWSNDVICKQNMCTNVVNYDLYLNITTYWDLL